MPPDGSADGRGGVTVVEFELDDSDYPFVALSAEEGCRVSLERMLPRGEGTYAEFFNVVGADPDRVLAHARASDPVEPTLVERTEDGGLFEFMVEDFCPARELARHGAIPREVEGVDGDGRILVEIPVGTSVAEVVEGFLEDHPSARMTAKRTTDRMTPLFTQEELQRAMSERLTERQREVLTTAFELGYYEPSGGANGADVGEALGISASTVSQHLKAAERALVSILLEDALYEGQRSAG